MFLIKTCPSCGKRLRFPIDKGTIRVRCACGHGFIADPDNPALYTNARFDVKHGKRGKGAASSRFRDFFGRMYIGKIREAIIIGLLSIKYKLQNFRLLPVVEQRRITAIVVIILLAIVLLGYLLCGRGAVPKGSDIFI
ncbi:MAG TPA: hypothetical protein VLM75_03590 [Spirochaetota bacterium]|nr:hypothetical protein [Spirochaetota bacterium]